MAAPVTEVMDGSSYDNVVQSAAEIADNLGDIKTKLNYVYGTQ
jgi:hypothetical protein